MISYTIIIQTLCGIWCNVNLPLILTKRVATRGLLCFATEKNWFFFSQRERRIQMVKRKYFAPFPFLTTAFGYWEYRMRRILAGKFQEKAGILVRKISGRERKYTCNALLDLILTIRCPPLWALQFVPEEFGPKFFARKQVIVCIRYNDNQTHIYLLFWG